MKKTINCKVCGKEIGWYDTEQMIVNMYSSKDERDIQYVGRSIIANFTCCNKKQYKEIE